MPHDILTMTTRVLGLLIIEGVGEVLTPSVKTTINIPSKIKHDPYCDHIVLGLFVVVFNCLCCYLCIERLLGVLFIYGQFHAY